MKQGERSRIEQQLQTVPSGCLTVVRNSASGQDHVLLTDQFSAKTDGKGQIETYSVFPGIDASYLLFLAPEVTFHHTASPTVLELFYCRIGRVGWNMQGGTAVYLGPGDLTIHNAVCCSDSTMLLPLEYAEGISIAVDLPYLADHCPDILRQTGVDFRAMLASFCSGKPATISACPLLDRIFTPLYSVNSARRRPYLQLKVQELLLSLMDVHPGLQTQTQYFSQQTELIQEIHRQLTEHLDQRFTIEELSRQYLINTSTLKEVFKAVYGLPIATYMKEYRVRQAMKMLRETNANISEIACRVGYGTQGKFSKAFKDVAQILPTEYRQNYCTNQAGQTG